MSTKHLKRLLNEKEKEPHVEEDEEEAEESCHQLSPRGTVNRFAALNDLSEEEKSEEEGEGHEGDVVVKSSHKKAKKKKNKKKGKEGKKLEKTEDKELDDIQLNDIGSALTYVQDEQTQNMRTLLKFDPKMTDYQAELRRNLGKAFKLEATQKDNRHSKKLSRFVHVKTESWPPIRKLGLGMEIVRKEGSLTYFRFTHSTDYRMTERMHHLAVNNHQIDVVFQMLQQMPYHLNCLLTSSYALRMQEDITQAADFVERVIYACEQNFHPQFNATEWECRLEYLDTENRPFHLALHRLILNCEHRHSYNTALNFTKLLFQLDPERDPLATLFLMDSLALKARQFEWLINMYDAFMRESVKNVDRLPNWLYSLALAHFHAGNREEATQQLKKALVAFPPVLWAILDALNVEVDPATAATRAFSPGFRASEKEPMNLLAKLYAKQTSIMWKNVGVMEWLAATTSSLAPSWGDTKEDKKAKESRDKMFAQLANPFSRALLLHDIPWEHESTVPSDPFPPANSRRQYSIELIDRNGSRQEQESLLNAFIHSLYPDYDPQRRLGDQGREMLNAAMARADEWWRGLAARLAGEGAAPPEPTQEDRDRQLALILQEEENRQQQRGQEE